MTVGRNIVSLSQFTEVGLEVNLWHSKWGMFHVGSRF